MLMTTAQKRYIKLFVDIFKVIIVCRMVENAVKTKANEKSGFKLVRICISEADNVESILIEMNFFSYFGFVYH